MKPAKRPGLIAKMHASEPKPHVQGTSHHGGSPPRIITHGNYVAEILWGSNTTERFWYYVLRRKDSPEMLDLQKYSTLEAAIEGAKAAIGRMHRAAAAE
jgi:hypothetical protein